MPVSAESSIDISATVPEITEVLADVESLPEWSSAHKAVEIRESDAEGWPVVVWSKISQFGVSDEQLARHEWYDGEVSWSLVEPSSSQSLQNATYTLTDNGDGTTRVVFHIEVELRIKLPGMVVKKAQKLIADVATKGLKAEVERRFG